MTGLFALLRGRAFALLPFLLPLIGKRKKTFLLIGAAVLAYPFLRGLYHQIFGKVAVNTSLLRYELAYYETVAEQSHELMNGSTSNSEEQELIEMVEDLNSEELRAVFNAFGSKRYAVNGDPVLIPWFYPEKNLFGWYQEELSKNDLERMKAIWAKTELWGN